MSVEGIIETTQYLTFMLEDEVYALEIAKVREVLDFTKITKVPQTPDFMKGVINLRGKVIPVVDLRMKFGMEAIDYDERTCIIVLEIGSPGATVQIGIVVDTVSEVLNIKGDDIEETPHFGTALDTGYILGMAKSEDSVKILLDIDKILRADEMALFTEAA